MSKGWFKPWMPWVFGVLVLVITFAAALGSTNNQVDTNCKDIASIGAKVDTIASDTAYIRGRIDGKGGDGQ